MAPEFKFFGFICLVVVAISFGSCLTHEEILQQHAKLKDKIKKTPKTVRVDKPVFRSHPDEVKSPGKDVPLDKQGAHPSDNLKSGGKSTIDTHGENPTIKNDQEEIFIDGDTEDGGKPPRTFPDPDLDNEDGGRGELGEEEPHHDAEAEDEIHHEEDVDEETHFQEQYRGQPQDDTSPVGTLVLEDLEDTIIAQERIILHFVGEGCTKCDLFRPHFAAAARTFWEMEDTDNSQVVFFYEITDLQLMVKFNLRELPTVLFFRSGIPILYEGDLSNESLVTWMFAHMEVMGWELQEENFDMETQKKKADGTSQQWLINFCNVDTAGCDGFMATWESAAYSLKGVVEFGYVDVAIEVTLAKRFHVDLNNLPAVVLLEADQIFWCTLPLTELTTNSLIHFVKKGHLQNDEEHLPSKLGAFTALIVRAGAHFNVVLATVVATAVVLYSLYIYVCRRQRLAESGKQKGV